MTEHTAAPGASPPAISSGPGDGIGPSFAGDDALDRLDSACLDFEQDLRSLTDGIAQLSRFEAQLADYEATLGQAER